MGGDKPWPQVPIGNKNHADAAVVIIGGGLSGMCTAIDLIKRNNCRNFIIIEKSAGLGGTWLDNKYPGCCCDVWSTLYSFSFAQNTEWTREYPGQEEILTYLIRVAQEYKLYQHFRFNTAVDHATWDDSQKRWQVRVKASTGSKEAEFSPEYDIACDFLVSAVGQLNVPSWPDIKGVKDFAGKTIHSARWDWSYDLQDKKIAILGNGCSAVQILPEVAKVAKHITVFQRTPNWILPRMDAEISPLMRSVYKYIPGILSRKRALQMDFRESVHATLDPKSDMTQFTMDLARQMMHSQLPNQPELWEKLTPTYNLGCKRIISSDDYYPALGLDKVDLETRPIADIEGHSVHVRNDDGEVISVADDYDLLVCATGFRTVDFMHPIELTGTDGRSLRSDIWKEGARAYFGMTVEAMPNFAMLYGPNTNLGHNSIILMIEAQSRYINGLIKPVLEARTAGRSLSLSPKKDVLDAYNRTIQEELKYSAFNDPQCKSWYKNEAGVITNNWSRTVVEYQKMVSEVRYEDFVAEGTGVDIVVEKKVNTVGRVHEETAISDRALMLMGAVSTAAVLGGWLLSNTRVLQSVQLR